MMAHHWSVDLLWAQGTDSDVSFLKAGSERACEVDDTTFGSGIDWGHGHGEDAPSRCHCDNQAWKTLAMSWHGKDRTAVPSNTTGCTVMLQDAQQAWRSEEGEGSNLTISPPDLDGMHCVARRVPTITAVKSTSNAFCQFLSCALRISPEVCQGSFVTGQCKGLAAAEVQVDLCHRCQHSRWLCQGV